MDKYRITEGPSGGDCTAPYYISFYEAMTVGEFIEDRLKTNKWGKFCLMHNDNGHMEQIAVVWYKNNQLEKEIDLKYMSMLIISASGSGGWSRDDFTLVV